MLNKLWAALLFFSAIGWFVDAIRICYGYVPSKFTLVVAFVITGGCVLTWAIEHWNEK